MSREKEVRILKCGTSPHNMRIEPTAGGRHLACVLSVGQPFACKPAAGTPPAAGLPPSASGPSSRFIRALYGR
jgi:hypothetical protein